MIKGRQKTGHILVAVLGTSWGHDKGATEDWAHLGGSTVDVLGHDKGATEDWAHLGGSTRDVLGAR